MPAMEGKLMQSLPLSSVDVYICNEVRGTSFTLHNLFFPGEGKRKKRGMLKTEHCEFRYGRFRTQHSPSSIQDALDSFLHMYIS